MNLENQYLSILNEILDKGVFQNDRTGVGSLSLFGRSIRHNYKDGFPLLTTKMMFTKGIIGELLWFLLGTDDPQYLIDNNIHIWDEWMVDDNGKKKLPHTYGVKWRNFHGVDQVADLIEEIKTNPDSRRMLVCAWDAKNIKNTALPWCHVLWQIYVDKNTKEISISVYQRSADFFLGVPFNLASYSFLLYMLADVTGYKPKEMYYTFGNCHIYTNHVEQCKLQLSRKPYELPNLKLNHKESIDDYVINDFEIINYNCHSKIIGKVAV